MPVIAPSRGPRPWRTEPRTGAEWLVLLAWGELVATALIAASVGMYASMLVDLANAMSCFDHGTRCNAPGLPAAFYVAFGAGWVVVFAAGVAAVRAARRRRGGAASAHATAAALGAPALALGALVVGVRMVIELLRRT